MDVSEIFYFSCSGEGKGESKAPGVWGVGFLLKIPGGGFPVLGGCLQEFLGGPGGG